MRSQLRATRARHLLRLVPRLGLISLIAWRLRTDAQLGAIAADEDCHDGQITVAALARCIVSPSSRQQTGRQKTMRMRRDTVALGIGASVAVRLRGHADRPRTSPAASTHMTTADSLGSPATFPRSAGELSHHARNRAPDAP